MLAHWPPWSGPTAWSPCIERTPRQGRTTTSRRQAPRTTTWKAVRDWKYPASMAVPRPSFLDVSNGNLNERKLEQVMRGASNLPGMAAVIGFKARLCLIDDAA